MLIESKDCSRVNNPRFILIEMMDYAETIAAERVRRAISGYGEGSKTTPRLAGGFGYYTVGENPIPHHGIAFKKNPRDVTRL